MCLNPLKGWQIGVNPSGKPAYKITSRQADFIYQVGEVWHEGYTGGDKIPYGAPLVREFIQIPCGQCIECRLAYSRDWATRMMLELPYHESSYFVTLTYSDDYVPVSYYPHPDTGEAMPALTLRKADVTGFLKRLRSRLEYAGKPPIRFYYAGEYGDQTHRPHYHLIIFGLQLDDLKYFKSTALGFKLYTSDLIAACWPFGHHSIGQVTFESCAYVARYVTKKWTGDFKAFYDTFNIEPEFCNMSRKPGIARQYFDDHKDAIYRLDELFLSLSDGGRCLKPPRYYDRLFDIDHPDIMAEIKERRRSTAEAAEALRQTKTGLSIDEQYQARLELFKKRALMLKREEI